jgi:hypothetical protein
MPRAGVTSRVTPGGLQHGPVKRPVKRVSATLTCAVAVRPATMRTTDLSGLEIYLLGRPRVERDGEAMSGARGYKAWGLLAYLLRTDRPHRGARRGGYSSTDRSLMGLFSLPGDLRPGTDERRLRFPIGDIAGATLGVMSVLTSPDEHAALLTVAEVAERLRCSEPTSGGASARARSRR